ncbi:MAG TPA: hypothetical protein VMR97_04085 [Acidimicrobiales bacterium]|nr:hypothetical protein [Acidimicrobiales bacterium]
MSSLWTPDGEHRVGRATGSEQASGTSGGGEEGPVQRATPATAEAEDGEYELGPEDPEQLAARLEQLRHQLVSTPAEVVIANHAYGLFELAAMHLSERPPRIDDARLAVDAMASLVEGLAGRLGDPEASLLDALSQIRLAFVQISGASHEGSPG